MPPSPSMQFLFHIGIHAMQVTYIKGEESNMDNSADFKGSNIANMDNLADFINWPRTTGCIMYISMSNCILFKN
jgi:hypothetical protein